MASTTGRQPASARVDSLAAALRDAEFVRVVARADGDAVAAAGLLGRALDVPFRVSVARTRGTATDRLAAGDQGATTVALGFRDVAADAVVTGAPVTAAASEAASELGRDPAADLALAGALAASDADPALVQQFADAADCERRPGIAVPTADLAQGLAYSTLLHAPQSGDETAAGALLAELDLPAELDDAARRRLASAVALEATADGGESAATAIERALRPHVPGGPFETAEGFADVLDATASVAPGVATALALGADVHTSAVEAWREHGTAVHEAVRSSDPRRHAGLVVADVDAPVRATARLIQAFRSPEPATVAVGDGEVAVATRGGTDAVRVLATAVDDAAVGGDADLACAITDDPDGTVDAVREEL